MRRRDLWSPFLAGLLSIRRSLYSAPPFDPPISPNGAAALLLRIPDRKLVAVHGPDVAARWLVPPGSALKPLTLWTLLESSKVKASDEYFCPGKLLLNGHSLNCSHPPLTIPMNVARAIAYSCNCAVAHFAQRLSPDQLPAFLHHLSLSSASGLLPGPEAVSTIRYGLSGTHLQLQALGEEGIEVTPLALLIAFRALARDCQTLALHPILEGLEGAVDYGTGQGARLPHVRVAGKTGTTRTMRGVPASWFAGFAPSHSPEVVVVVLVQGHSGGADAAPVAARLLQAYFASRA